MERRGEGLGGGVFFEKIPPKGEASTNYSNHFFFCICIYIHIELWGVWGVRRGGVSLDENASMLGWV